MSHLLTLGESVAAHARTQPHHAQPRHDRNRRRHLAALFCLGAAGLVRYSPRQVTLGPNETQKVRLMVRKPAGLPDGDRPWTM